MEWEFKKESLVVYLMNVCKIQQINIVEVKI